MSVMCGLRCICHVCVVCVEWFVFVVVDNIKFERILPVPFQAGVPLRKYPPFEREVPQNIVSHRAGPLRDNTRVERLIHGIRWLLDVGVLRLWVLVLCLVYCVLRMVCGYPRFKKKNSKHKHQNTKHKTQNH